MCGITGIINFTQAVDREELLRFTRALAHRGPDGNDVLVEENFGIGHTRLAILDLSPAGKCPMRYVTPEGRLLHITFNGEIYNFLELRAELEKKGYHFYSESDTEVIVAAYAEWGTECQTRFNGMWAFAIYDPRAREIFISRDRFGVKPLYFYLGSLRFAFASELKAFLALNDFTPRLNETVMKHAVESTHCYEGVSSDSMLHNVFRLPAGHCMTVGESAEIDIQKWWETSEHLVTVPSTYEAQVERFKELFLDAIRIRMRSDVPVGTCLSGGIDSTAVASSIAKIMSSESAPILERCSKQWQRSFIAEFPGTILDERQYADQVVREIKSTPHYYTFNQDEALKDLVKSVWSLDEISGGVVVPTYNIYREMRKQRVVVSLDGHGSDELLCGYGWYLEWPYAHVNNNLYNDFHANILPAILRNFDRCSMAHGIEVRMPFMDYRLVSYAFSLPVEAKLGGGFTKRILRDAMAGIMPESIRTRRKKIGFNAPMIEWLNGSLGKYLSQITYDERWRDSPFFDGERLAEKIRYKSEARQWRREDWDDASKSWMYASTILWQKLYIDGEYKNHSFMEGGSAAPHEQIAIAPPSEVTV